MNTPNPHAALIGGLMPLLLALGLVADARSTYAQTAVAYLPTKPMHLSRPTCPPTAARCPQAKRGRHRRVSRTSPQSRGARASSLSTRRLPPCCIH